MTWRNGHCIIGQKCIPGKCEKEWLIELAKAVTINILDFNYLNQTKNYHNVFHLYEDEEKFQLTDALEIHFMELPKLISKWRRREVSPWENVLVRWLLLLEGAENQEILNTLEEIAMQDPVLHQAMLGSEKAFEDHLWGSFSSQRGLVLPAFCRIPYLVTWDSYFTYLVL